MDKATGRIIATKKESLHNKKKHVLEVEIDQYDKQLLNWQNQRIRIVRAE